MPDTSILLPDSNKIWLLLAEVVVVNGFDGVSLAVKFTVPLWAIIWALSLRVIIPDSISIVDFGCAWASTAVPPEFSNVTEVVLPVSSVTDA